MWRIVGPSYRRSVGPSRFRRWPPLGGRALDDRVVVAIPLKSATVSQDWDQVQVNLTRTLDSVRASRDPRWLAVVAGHERPARLGPGVVWLDAPNRRPSTAGAGRADKLAKRRLIGSWLRGQVRRRVRVVFCDADDYVHRDLVGHVLAAPDAVNHSLECGFRLDVASRRLVLVDREYWRHSGTCFVGSFARDELPRGWRDLEGRYATPASHLEQARHARTLGLPVSTVPFPAAVYLANHPDSLEVARGRGGDPRVGRPVPPEEALRVLAEEFGQHWVAAEGVSGHRSPVARG